MLYLLRSFGRGGRSWLKVGYTGDLKKRERSYLTENPGHELIGTRRGDLTEETRTHLYLSACRLKAGFLEEWFIDCPETIYRFHHSIGKMNRWIWKERNFLFTAFDFSRRTPKVRIYEDLRFQHRYENLGTLLVDKEWKSWNLKKEIEARKKLIEDGYL